MARTREYLGAAQVAAELGLDRSTITQSLRRHGPGSARPFPAPRVRVGGTPGWDESQLDDIRAWFGQPAQGRRRAADRFAAAMVEELDAAYRAKLAEVAEEDPHAAAEEAVEDLAEELGLTPTGLSARCPAEVKAVRASAEVGAEAVVAAAEGMRAKILEGQMEGQPE